MQHEVRMLGATRRACSYAHAYAPLREGEAARGLEDRTQELHHADLPARAYFAYKALKHKETLHTFRVLCTLYAKCPYYVGLYVQTQPVHGAGAWSWLTAPLTRVRGAATVASSGLVALRAA